MLTILRSKLWRHGAAGAITGSGSGSDVVDTGRGTSLWYLPQIHRITTAARTPRRIYGEGEGFDPLDVAAGLARLIVRAVGAGLDPVDSGHGEAFRVLTISGSGGSSAPGSLGSGAAETVDVELQLFAAMISVA